ncbi:hypothetical protein GCM10011352_16660 [Marinobacterium zhoushanense]|uniref:Uncharacterized protein n=1 Tax=Marinobacterium zhoushanense TaxID=1679163 RepID=A0ABQ1K8C3_9GAMM|nr:hypothetical protein [Marinobacterium zhoushanense]GGB91285.1 hypothetical protein GCM10011352_16660 [Marinobacterium zhoushanense]
MLKVNKPPLPSPVLSSNTTGKSSADSVFADILAQEAERQRRDAKEQRSSGDMLAQTAASPSEPPDAREELIKLLSMSTAERIRYLMLKDMGLTEESLAALPYDERQRIERLIEQEIRRQLGSNFDETRDLRQT